MNWIILLFFTLFVSAGYAQQESTITIDSGSHNNINVTQTGDSAKRSNIGLTHADSNTLLVSQNTLPAPKKEEESTFWSWITNTNNMLAIIGSLIVIIGAVKGISNRKKRRNKR
jgi:hypothetical protein